MHLILLFSACVSGPNPWRDDVVDELRAGIPGIQVEEGRMFWLDRAGCEPIVNATGTCFGAHPGSPYGLFDFELADPVTEVPNSPLAQDQAWLFIGHLPPHSRYFSFNLYQYRKALPEGEHAVTFGSVAPSLHLMNLPADGSPLSDGSLRPLADAPFNQYSAILFTANQTTARMLRDALKPRLAELGIGEEAIVEHRIAYRTEAGAQALVDSGERQQREVFSLTMGEQASADTFTMALRVVGLAPDDPYLAAQTMPAAVFRLTLDERPEANPFPWPDLPPNAQTDETQPARLAAARDHVLRLLETKFAGEGQESIVSPMVVSARKTSAQCVNQRVPCGANNDDSRYVRSARFVIPEATASLLAIGINHTWVGTHLSGAPPVTYASLTLNNFDRQVGVSTVFDRDLEGSLQTWLSREELGEDFPLSAEEYDAIYVVEFARSCTPPGFCIPFGEGPQGVERAERLWFTERIYLNQTSGTAPAQDAVYGPQLLGVGPAVQQLPSGAWLLGP